jgi:hypothetical protein
MWLCDFCNEEEATHFNSDWDASLCDKCTEAQDKLMAETKGKWDEIRRELLGE